jgi:hypothetical protein
MRIKTRLANNDLDDIEEDSAQGQDEPQHQDDAEDEDEELEPTPKPPIVIELTKHISEKPDEDSDGEAACSGDERSPPKKNLHEIIPPPSVASTSSIADFSSLSQSVDPSLVIDPASGQHLINLKIQIQPEKEHLDVLIAETKRLLEYVKELDPAAKLISRGFDKDGKPYPDLVSPSDKHWPKKYTSAQYWFQILSGYLFSQPPISEKTLQARIETRNNRNRGDDVELRRKKSKKGQEHKEEKGATAMYATVNLYTKIPKISLVLESMNVDLRRHNVRVSLKSLKVWESNSKKMLCGVQRGLCPAGIHQLLLHRLKEMEKKLCRHGQLDTLEWYDKPLPALNVTIQSISELKLPDNREEQEQLSFDPFPRSSRFAYFLEASDASWARLEPLLNMMIDTNDIYNTFGLSAIVMDTPGSQVSIDRTRAHHQHGRIRMGYNIATTVIECREVQLYDYEVKVNMEPLTLPSGEKITPKPPYACTTIRNELQRIQFNGSQIFHTVVMVCKGPETGISGIVVSYDPQHDPLYREKYYFSKRTVVNSACFMHHWLIQCGYWESTRTCLMHCKRIVSKTQVFVS